MCWYNTRTNGFFREIIKILHVYNDYRAKSCSFWKTSIPTGTSSQKYTGNFIPRLGHLQYRELQKYKFIPRDGNLQYCEPQIYKFIPRDGHLQYRELHKCTGTFIPRVGHIQYFELKHLSTQLYESVWKPPSTAIYTGHRPEVYSMKGYPDSCIQFRTNRLLVHYIKGTELLYLVEDVICLLNWTARI